MTDTTTGFAPAGFTPAEFKPAGFAQGRRAGLAAGAAMALAMALQPSLAHAQAAAPAATDEAMPAPPPAAVTGDATGNDIVVTATKRETTLQAAPVAVSVTTSETLKRAEIRDVSDLSTVVPSLKVDQHESSAQTNFLIRGFGNGANNVGIEPSVGVFIDGVYRSRSAAEISDFPDVSRIEVLRGPQSTLFGKNASAGVISITTAEPKFKFGGNFEVTGENYSGVVAKGTITGPLSSTVAAALSGGYDHRDGYVTDAITGNHLDGRNRWFVRGQLLIEPSSNLKVRLIADYDRIKELCCGVFNLKASPSTGVINLLGGQVNPANNWFSDTVYNNFDSTNDISNYGFSGQIDYGFGPFKLTSITAWRHNRANTNQDADFSSADLLGNYSQNLKMHDFTQELRLSSDLPGPLNFVLGGFFLDEKVHQDNQITYGQQFHNYADALIQGETAQLLGSPITLSQIEGELGAALTGNPMTFQNIPGNPLQFFGPGQGQFQTYGLHDQSISIYGQADYKILDRLTLTGGLNWTHDTKHFNTSIHSTDVFSNLDLPLIVNGALSHGANPATTIPLLALMPLQFLPTVPDVPNAVEPGRTEDNNVSWTARAAYDVSKAIKAYVNVSTGFKASSVNLSRDSRPDVSTAAALVAAGYFPPSRAILGTPLVIQYPAYGSRFAGPEKSINFEAGFKGNWHTATLNVAVFKEIIRGFQQNVFTGSGFFLSNAGKESTWGIEAEGSWKATPELVLAGGVTWLNPKYDSYLLSNVGDLTGTTPAGIPPVTLNVSAQDTHAIGGGMHLISHVGWHFESRVPMVEGLVGYLNPNPITQAVSPAGQAAAIAEADMFTRLVSEIDASMTVTWANGFEVTGWVRNLNDHRNLITIFDSPAQTGSVSGYTNQPRTYGVSLRAKW